MASESVLTARLALLPLRRWALLTVALAPTLGLAGAAAAQDATWNNPATVAGPTVGTFDFDASANWTAPTVPTGTAFFGTSSTTALSFSANTTIGGWTFNAGASAYTFTNGQNLHFNGAGIVINGGSAVITNNREIQFLNASTAGSATITNDSVLEFHNTSTAGSAAITNNFILNFLDGSTAGSAAITNKSEMKFSGTSTAGSATITNKISLDLRGTSTAGSAAITNDALLRVFDGSTAGSATITNNDTLEFFNTSTAGSAAITNASFLSFFDSSTAGSATITTKSGAETFIADTASGGQARFITESGGKFRLSSLTSSGTTAGSIEGAGSYMLDSKNLEVGSNNLDTTVSGVISGSGGSLTKVGGGTLTLSGINTYTGATTINGGTLAVNGSILDSATTVNNGGTLQGTGALGSLTVNSGGIHAPGNSIGTQTVNGPYLLNSGGILQVEVNDSGLSDVVVVNGTVSLTGAILQVLAAPGNYGPSTSYLIINNDLADAVTGTFGAVTTNFAFLAPSIDYAGGTGNDVVLTLTRNSTAFTDVAVTPNQKAVAGALDQFPTSNPIFLALTGQTVAGARQAFDALSGEVHASLAGMLLDESHFVRDSIFARLQQAYYAGGGGTTIAALAGNGPTVAALDGTPMMGLGMGKGHPAAAPSSGLAFWTQGFGSWGDFASDGNAAAADRTLAGFMSGFDAGLGGTWRAGLAGGYTQSDTSVDARLSSADIDSYHVALYAGGGLGPVAVRSGAAWTWHDIDTSRTVLFPGFIGHERASYDGDTGQVFGELALPFASGGTALEPFAGLAYVHVNTGGFTETGGVAALTAAENDADLGYSTLGLRAATTLRVGGTRVTPHASAAWQHAFGDVTTDMALAFANPNVGFVISGVPIARDSAFLQAGLDLAVSADATLGIAYEGQLADNVEDHGLSGRLDWRF